MIPPWRRASFSRLLAIAYGMPKFATAQDQH
jgi:hypothetical protein